MTRHELKEQLEHDQFTDNVELALDYVATHRTRVIQWAALAVVVLAAAGGTFWYLQHTRAIRRDALRTALDVVESSVSDKPDPYFKTFPTPQAKDAAAMKALSAVVSKYGGSREGEMAQYYLATIQADNGKYADAEKNLKQVADSSSDFAPLAKVALAELYGGEGKLADAQALVRGLIANPTPLVSKSQAQLLLVSLVRASNPQEAKQLATSVRAAAPNTRPAVQRGADTLLQDLKQ